LALILSCWFFLGGGTLDYVIEEKSKINWPKSLVTDHE